jgi:hypothetical protein
MGQQTVSRPATLDEFEVFVQSTLTTPTEPQGDWMPFAVRQDEHGDTALALIDPRYMGSQEGKELLAVELAHWMSHSPRFVAFGVSTWIAPAAGGRRPSLHPAREEALLMTCAGRDEGMRALLAPITRAPDGSPRLGTWKQATGIGSSLLTEALRLAFVLAYHRPAWLVSHELPAERRGYHERRVLATVLGIDPNLVQEEALIGEAA